MQFLFAAEWSIVKGCSQDMVASNYVIDIMLRRLMCANPCEFTKKSIAVAVISRNMENPQDASEVPPYRKSSLKQIVKK